MIQYQELNQSLSSMRVTLNTVQHGRFSHLFVNRDTILWLEVISDLAYDFYSFVDIKVNHILSKYGQLFQ